MVPVRPGAKVMAWVGPGVPVGAPSTSAAAITERNEPAPESLVLVTTNCACAEGANAMHPPTMAVPASRADRILPPTRRSRRLTVTTLACQLFPTRRGDDRNPKSPTKISGLQSRDN